MQQAATHSQASNSGTAPSCLLVLSLSETPSLSLMRCGLRATSTETVRLTNWCVACFYNYKFALLLE